MEACLATAARAKRFLSFSHLVPPVPSLGHLSHSMAPGRSMSLMYANR